MSAIAERLEWEEWNVGIPTRLQQSDSNGIWKNGWKGSEGID